MPPGRRKRPAHAVDVLRAAGAGGRTVRQALTTTRSAELRTEAELATPGLVPRGLATEV